jgi:putative ABC transport system ATP-binding protein
LDPNQDATEMNDNDATPTLTARGGLAQATYITASSDSVLSAVKIGRRDPRTGGWLIHDVTLSVEPGDRVGVLGPSGAGKTVFLRALALLDPLDAGAIHFQGHAVGGDAVPRYRGQVIYLHQKPALYEGTVEDNLRNPFTLKVHHERKFDRRQAVDLLASLGRDALFLEKSSRDLSGGEAQITALVRAIQLEPTILLLDEPTASLDPATAQAVEAMLDRWMAERAGVRAMVWVGHDRDQTLRVTRRTISFAAGRLDPELVDG